MLDAAIEAGADDVVFGENGHEIYARRNPFARSPRRWRRNWAKPRKAAMTWKPQKTIAVDDETGEKLLS